MDGMAFSDILKVFTQQHLVHTGGAGSQAVGDKARCALLEFSLSEFLPSSTMPLILTVPAPPGSSCSWLFSYPTAFLLAPVYGPSELCAGLSVGKGFSLPGAQLPQFFFFYLDLL